MSTERWAEAIFGNAELGDKRRTRRLVNVAGTLAAKPLTSFCQAYPQWADIKAAYRFIENARITSQQLEEPSVADTLKTVQGRQVILAVSDTTSLNFTNHRATQGLGPIDQLEIQGILSHNTLALDLKGTPLGLLRHQAWVRNPQEYGKRHTRTKRSIENKESYRWVQCVQEVGERLDSLQDARPYVIHIFDREGDIHEVFEAVQKTGDGAVIRSSWNRRIQEEEKYLHDRVQTASVLGKAVLDVPRKPNNPARQANVVYRACTVTLDPKKNKRSALTLGIVAVIEENPPKNQLPLEWFLLTTEPIDSLQDVLEIVRLYKLRWRIEEYHLILKSGCRIEKVQFESAERIIKVLALLTAVAVRLLHITYQARIRPDIPCTEVISEPEWRTLYTQIHQKPPQATESPPSLKQAILWIGRLGGHPGRKSDGMPGVRSLWKGWRDLQLLTPMFLVCMDHLQALQ